LDLELLLKPDTDVKALLDGGFGKFPMDPVLAGADAEKFRSSRSSMTVATRYSTFDLPDTSKYTR
jgi:hypothetical protein